MLFCMSGLTIWMNRETGRSQGTRWMITPGEAKVGFSKVLKDFFFFSEQNPIGDLNLSLIEFYKLSDIKEITHNN